QPQFRAASILVTRRNFGCGSSRESAVWALVAKGIRCVVAQSFGDFFRENCLQNGLLPLQLEAAGLQIVEAAAIAENGARPFTVDLRAREIFLPDGKMLAFDIPDWERNCLLHGLDNIGLTLEHADEIAAWEQRVAREAPWMQSADRTS